VDHVTRSSSGRSSRQALWPAAWLVAGLVLATLAAPAGAAAAHVLRFEPGIGYAHAETTNVSYSVNLTDAPAFAPRYLSVVAGGNISIHFHNVGSYSHSFTVSSLANATLNSSWTPTQLDANFTAHAPLANTTFAAGASGWVNLTFTAREATDSFEFASIVPYQFQAGMWGWLNVTSNTAPLLLVENTTNGGGSVAFVPNVLAVSTTSYPVTLDVRVTNQGSFGHTFTVSRQSNVTVPQAFGAYFATYPPLVNANVNASLGYVAWANFSVPAPGKYMYICEVSGHYASGMYGFLYVGVAPPPVPPAPSTAIVETWILVGSAVLLGIGGLLALTAAFSGRFPRQPGTHGGHH